MKHDKQKDERTEAYPRPTATDLQLKNQPEFIDQQPNDFTDQSVSDIPGADKEREKKDEDADLGSRE